jgi:tripartite-type tricarboxylate transporter receptor subunit TctC
MKRFAIHIAAIAGLLVPLAHAPAAAQTAAYPSKPVRIVVGYQAGGPTDLVARLLANKLQSAFGQPVVVENKPGAGSNLAADLVAAAPADGYTLLLAASPIVMNGFLYKNLKHDVQKSFEPVSMLMSAPAVLAVYPGTPAKNLAELIALAKKQPGKLSFASTGPGGSPHLAAEVFMQRAGIELLHVPYKGASSAMNDVMAGHVTMSFMTSVSALPNLKSGNPRPLAVASNQRMPQLPDVPTMGEAGLPGFTADSWNGLFAPAGTPPAIVDKLQREAAKAMAAPEVREKLLTQGAIPVGGTASDFRAHIKQEVEHWAQVLKTIKISMD